MRKARGLSGGTREGVRKAVADGRISCFGLHKLIDPKLADKQWQRNTNARLLPASAAVSEANAAPTLGEEPAVVQTCAQALDRATDQAQPSLPFGAIAPIGGGGENGSREPPEPSYHQYRMQREKSDAEISAMNAAKMRGDLVDRAGIDRAAFEIGRDLRDGLDNCARRIASELAGVLTAEGCEAVLRREHRSLLQRLANEFRARAGVV
jgi:hypothetical protein